MAPARFTQKREPTKQCNSSNANVADNNKDYISLLPDVLLLTIISLLPAKEAGRTIILSKRWRPLWAHAPLSLVDNNLCDSRIGCVFSNKFLCTHKRIWLITKILENHYGPMQRFGLVHGDFNFADSFVDNWLYIVTKRQVKQLELNIRTSVCPVPVSVLHCQSLEILTLHNSRFPDMSIVSPKFYGIVEITLYRVIITDADLNRLVMGFQKLKSLSVFTTPPDLETSDGKRCFHLRSSSLKSFTIVGGTVCITELLIDAPNLERCLIEPQLTLGTPVRIISAPNLKMVGYMETEYYLSKLGNNLRQGIQQSFGSAVRTLRTLGIVVDLENFSQASNTARLLQCFPFLKTLHIQLLQPRVSADVSFGAWETAECLNNHLKYVVFHRYKDGKGESEFARYLVLNGKMLKAMKLLVQKGCTNYAEMENKILGSQQTTPFGTSIIWQENYGDEFYFNIKANNWLQVDPLMDRS